MIASLSISVAMSACGGEKLVDESEPGNGGSGGEGGSSEGGGGGDEGGSGPKELRLDWSISAGDVFNQSAGDVVLDPEGGVIAVGTFAGDIDFGGGVMSSGTPNFQHGFVVSFDAAGRLRWQVHFGSAAGAGAGNVALSPDGMIAVGGVFNGALEVSGNSVLQSDGYSDGFHAVLDGATGELVSIAGYDFGTVALAPHVAFAPNGDLFVGLRMYDTITIGEDVHLGAGSDDVLVARVDGAGDVVWTAQFGGAASDRLLDMVATPSGGVALVGSFAGPLAFGEHMLSADAVTNHFVASLDGDGKPLFARHIRRDYDEGWVISHRLTVAPSGETWLLAFLDGSADLGDSLAITAKDAGLVVRYAPSGAVELATVLEASTILGFSAATTDDAGDLLVAGQFAGTLFGAGFASSGLNALDSFVARLDAAGSIVYAHRYPQFPLYVAGIDYRDGTVALVGSHDAPSFELDLPLPLDTNAYIAYLHEH
jgi:hypothetical protein